MKSDLLRSLAEGHTPRIPVPDAFSQPSFLDEIERDEIASLLYPSLKDHPELPREALRRIRRAYERAIMHRDMAIQTLTELRQGLCAGGRVALIQGVAAIEHLYPEPWARTMGDIDLYLPDGNVAAVQSFLRTKGFSRCGSYDRVWARNGIVLDLHRDFWGADRVSARTLLTRGIAVELVQSTLLPGYMVPTPGCAAFHAAFHGLKHAFARKRWLFDLLMYFRAGHLSAAPCSTSSLVVPVALDRLVAYGLISESERRLAGAPLSLPRRWLLDRVLARGDRAGSGELALALACPTAGALARYLGASFLPPPAALREMYGAYSLPGLYARRLFSLFRKAAT